MILNVADRNADNRFGELLQSRRESMIDPTTGRPWTQRRVAEEVERRANHPASRSLVAGWESGEIKRPNSKHVNALIEMGFLTGDEAVQKLGVKFENLPLRDDERELLGYYRRLRGRPNLQEAALGAVRGMIPPANRPKARIRHPLRVAEDRQEYEA